MIDHVERKHGVSSLRWEFYLRPERVFLFSPTRISGALLHAEISAEDAGGAVDWHTFQRLRFTAKSSVEGLELTELNVFVGPGRVQYQYDHPETLSLSTRWRVIEAPFKDFHLAEWEPSRANQGRDLPGALDKVSAVGFDVKTHRQVTRGTVWIDQMELIGDRAASCFSDADALQFSYRGHTFTWFAAARIY